MNTETQNQATRADRPTYERRLGKFRISDDLMKDWKQLLPLFGKVVVVRCEHIYPWIFEYTAFSEMFDVLEEAFEPPQYEMLFTAKWDEKTKKSSIASISAQKVLPVPDARQSATLSGDKQNNDKG